MENEEKMSYSSDPVASLFGGNPEEAAKGLLECSMSVEVLSADQPRLIHEHPKNWIDMYQGGISANDDLLSLVEVPKERGVPPGDAIKRFNDRNQITMILQHAAGQVWDKSSRPCSEGHVFCRA